MLRVEEMEKPAEGLGRPFAWDYHDAESYDVSSGPSEARSQLTTVQAGLVHICRFSGYSLGVRRSWEKIRSGGSNFYVIWFPIEGNISITQDQSHDVLVTPGEMVISCEDRPFHIKATAREHELRCIQIHILVPSHLMHDYVPDIDRLCGQPLCAESGVGSVVRDLFIALFREAAEICDENAETLSIVGLQTIAAMARDHAGDVPNRSERQTQFERVLAFIRKNVSTQGLTVDDVARGCHVSRRHVHYLMKEHDQTFSQFLWACRLDQAREWLILPSFGHFNIVDIGYLAGFRSASHFSQAFQKHFGCSPKKMRQSATEPAQ